MYSDNEVLELAKRIGITQKAYQLLQREKRRLKSEEDRKLSMAKIVSNLIIESYEPRR